jgi:crotonobetainyl-CoA:carnitine CoA-transferase CaiB-like acyl-CoA transferase
MGQTQGSRPLSSLLVLDLTHLLSGPYAAMMLADLGARTIKIEPLGRGEQTRRLLEGDPLYSVDGDGAYHLTLNRNKESVAIDLKSVEGRTVFFELVKHADVVLDNFGVGVTKRLGIDHACLAEVNPAVVSCSITGFGEYGPDIHRPAFDQVAQAMSGAMSITGEPGGAPMRSGVPIGDVGSGLFATIGVLAALQSRVVSGRGQHVDVSMLDGQISLLSYIATMSLISGSAPARTGNGHSIHVPYNTFPTADGYLVIACIGDDFFHRLADCLGDPALQREEYRDQRGRLAARDAIEAVINLHLSEQPTAYWLSRLTEAKVPCARVNDLLQALAEPQVRARGMVVPLTLDSGRQIEVPGVPIKFSVDNQACFKAPPAVGRDTRHVLQELLRLSPEWIDQLTARGAIG